MKPIALSAFQDNYIWLVIHPLQHVFTCIDPGDATPVLQYAQTHQRTLTHILLTHHHADHIGGVEKLLQTFPKAHVYGPSDQRIMVQHTPLNANDRVSIDQHHFTVFATPGHTSSHICYFEPHQQWLFCGDTLFSAGCGRVFDGTIEELYASCQLLNTLPDTTQLFCAHEYTRQNLRFSAHVEPDNQAVQAYYHQLQINPTQCSLPSTLALERKINPFLRADSLMQFKALRAEKDAFKS